MKSRQLNKREGVRYFNFKDKALYKVEKFFRITYFTRDFSFNIQGLWTTSLLSRVQILEDVVLLALEEAKLFMPAAFV